MFFCMNSFFIPQFIVLFLLIASAVAGASWYIFDIRKTLKKFLGKTGMEIDEDLAHNLMRRIARLEAKNEEINPRIEILEHIANSSIQKVGFTRFNPFQDTGGDNSFTLVLLDRYDNGILLSSLYMREGARLYAKAIEKGQTKHALSPDEQKLLEQTLQNS